jgi:DNA-binding NtrC family response regulator
MNQVLVVDDERAMRAALEAAFSRKGWRVKCAGGTREALACFQSDPCALVVTDMRMPDGNGMEVMQGVRALAPGTAVILLTAFGNIPEAVKAMREGACDYLVKPISFDQLEEAARRLLALRTRMKPTEVGLVGSSRALRAVVERAQQVARKDIDILIEAESGTGKELLARLIHRSSPRRLRPFVAVNCAAFPEALLESELFGHARGAFTGAFTSKLGKFELASGGTLMLDEIGEMPLNLQPKLLRVLQEREVDRLGETRPVAIDVRVIATTNRNLLELVEEGKFRADLYYRLNVVPLSIPPLRHRRGDIAELVEHFVRKHSPPGSARLEPTPDLMAWLEAHDWPGNARELENVIRRLIALSEGPVAGLDLLGELAMAGKPSRPGALDAGLSLEEAECELLRRTLEATGGNRTRAAVMMGISLRTVRNKIRQYGLPRKGAV